MSNQTSEMHNVNQGKISSKTVNRSKTNDHSIKSKSQRSRLTVMKPTRNGRKHDGYKEKMRHSLDLSGSCATLRYIADLAGGQKHYASESKLLER